MLSRLFMHDGLFSIPFLLSSFSRLLNYHQGSKWNCYPLCLFVSVCLYVCVYLCVWICVCICMWLVQKVSRILNFSGLRIFDFRFFVALCWYSYPSLMPTSSAILNAQLIFDSYFAWTCFGLCSIFASSVSATRKSHRGPDLGNTVVTATLLCCLWQKIRAQATMCEQGYCYGAKINFCSSTNPHVSSKLLRANCT